MIEQHFLDDSILQLKKLKAQADRALAQVNDEQLFVALDPESNSLAILMKHIAGNMRSRWTDFLVSDGEKADRNRDDEFERLTADTATAVRQAWEHGWTVVLDAVGSLAPADLGKTITIRGEPHTVVEAINRQTTHYAAHVGQMVMLAKHLAGPRWQTLSIARGKSRDVDVARDGSAYGVPRRAN